MTVIAAVDRAATTGVLSGDAVVMRVHAELCYQEIDRRTWVANYNRSAPVAPRRTRIFSDADATGVP